MSEADQILASARAHERLLERKEVRVDYAALNKMVKRQRAALTRAENSGDPDKVVIACRNAVREWRKPGAMWPDDWSRWQRALDDALGVFNSVQLESL